MFTAASAATASSAPTTIALRIARPPLASFDGRDLGARVEHFGSSRRIRAILRAVALRTRTVASPPHAVARTAHHECRITPRFPVRAQDLARDHDHLGERPGPAMGLGTTRSGRGSWTVGRPGVAGTLRAPPAGFALAFLPGAGLAGTLISRSRRTALARAEPSKSGFFERPRQTPVGVGSVDDRPGRCQVDCGARNAGGCS